MSPNTAGQVRFSLLIDVDRLHLVIADIGRGFDPTRVAKGLELATMRERAELSGGVFAITSGQEGTVVHASWPVGGGS